MDGKKYVQACDNCQRMGQPKILDEIPLKSCLVVEPFDIWALDFCWAYQPFLEAESLHFSLHQLHEKMGGGCGIGEIQ